MPTEKRPMKDQKGYREKEDGGKDPLGHDSPAKQDSTYLLAEKLQVFESVIVERIDIEDLQENGFGFVVVAIHRMRLA